MGNKGNLDMTKGLNDTTIDLLLKDMQNPYVQEKQYQ
jgi:hypothetical protein